MLADQTSPLHCDIEPQPEGIGIDMVTVRRVSDHCACRERMTGSVLYVVIVRIGIDRTDRVNHKHRHEQYRQDPDDAPVWKRDDAKP